VLRAIAHLVAWLPFIIGPVRLVQHGWRPIGDEAAIALRSWNVLTSHGPLVGQATRLAHGVFDPGPLEYWLLTVPVHVNPVHGLLWGAAVYCMVACSLAIEAAWTVGGELTGLLTSGLVVGLVLWLPALALPPSWNPWFGMMFFAASLAAGWAVLAGHRRWWPGLVITASIAAQAHLMFTLACAALVLLALIAGLADTIRARSGYWWVLIGLLAGAACWSAPAYQQLTMPDGNIAALIRSASSNGYGPRTGSGFGLKALSAAIQPPPLWWTSSFEPAVILRHVSDRSAGFAVAALIVVAVAGVAGVWPLRCRWLAALALVSLLVSMAALATYASIPVHYTSLRSLNYLIVLLFPIGVLSWLVIGSAVVLAVRRARTAIRALVADRLGGAAADSGLVRWVRSRTGAEAAVGLTAGLAVLCVLAIGQQPPTAHEVTDDPVLRSTLLASRQIQHALPRQRMAMLVRDYHDTSALGRLALGIAWALTPPGYHAQITSTRLARELGTAYMFRGGRMPLVTVVVRRHVVHVVVASQVPASLRPRPDSTALTDGYPPGGAGPVR
jgi:hypothetical protein